MRLNKYHLNLLLLLEVGGQKYNGTSLASSSSSEWLDDYQLFSLELNTNALPEAASSPTELLKTALQASANGDTYALTNYFVDYFITKYNARVRRKGFFIKSKEVSSFDFKADLTDIRTIDNNVKDKTSTALVNVAENELGNIRGIRIVGPSDKVKIKREKDGKYFIEVNELSDARVKLEPILTVPATKLPESGVFDWFDLSGKTGVVDFQIEPKDLKYNKNGDGTISLIFGNVKLTSTSNQFKVSQAKERKLNVHVEDISKIKVDHNVISNRDIDWFNLKRTGTLEFSIKPTNLKNQPNLDGTLTLLFRDVKLTGKEVDISVDPGLEERVVVTIKNVEKAKIERAEVDSGIVDSSEHLLLKNLPKVKGIVQINPTDPFSVTTSNSDGFTINFAGYSIRGSPGVMGVAKTSGNQVIIYFKDPSQVVVQQRPDASSFSRVSGVLVISEAGKAPQQFKFVEAELEATAPTAETKPVQNEVEVLEQPKVSVKDSSHFDFSQIAMYSTPVEYDITDTDTIAYTQSHDPNGLTNIKLPGFVIIGSTRDITIKASASRISLYFKKPNQLSIQKVEAKDVVVSNSKDSEYTKETLTEPSKSAIEPKISEPVNPVENASKPDKGVIYDAVTTNQTSNPKLSPEEPVPTTSTSESRLASPTPTQPLAENVEYEKVDLSTLIPADDYEFILLEKMRKPAEFKVKGPVNVLDNQDGTKTVLFTKFRFTVLPDDFSIDKLTATLTRVKFLQPRLLNIVPDTPDSIQFKDMATDPSFFDSLSNYENPVKVDFEEVNNGVLVLDGGAKVELKDLGIALQSEPTNMVYTQKEDNNGELVLKNPSLVKVIKL